MFSKRTKTWPGDRSDDQLVKPEISAKRTVQFENKSAIGESASFSVPLVSLALSSSINDLRRVFAGLNDLGRFEFSLYRRSLTGELR